MPRIVFDHFFEVSSMNFCVSFLKPLSSATRPRKLVDLCVHAVVGPDCATVEVSERDGIGGGLVRN